MFAGEQVIFDLLNRPAAQIDRHQSLDGVPVMNENVSCANDETGRLVIKIKLKRGSSFLARFQPPVLERNVRLDEIGGFVFKLIDNQRSALEIIELFLAKYRVNRREATLSVIAFLKSLVRKGVISIVIR